MGLFFWKRRKPGPPVWEALDRKQRVYARKLADWLGRKTARVPVKRMRVYVLAGLVGFGLLNLVELVAALRGQHDRVRQGVAWTQPVHVAAPKVGRRPGVRRSLESYLDSLRRDSVGNILLDSLLKARPGLADSLKALEEMRR